ncbi:GerMN domain-containing protein [Anaeromicropila populeti]|uniref:Germination protein M n=1 Tax=Anaeromicropila populeti TaxID=37658 RepID=A0A1I6K4K4_9FIRM|nr:GerMN domain-containing protein [Anaeromicropila populeti]SFR86193.1 germination protein M [Anaeromicropila populeti]
MKKKVLFGCWSILFILCLTSCQKKEQTTPNSLATQVFYVNSDDTKVVGEGYEVKAVEVEEQIWEYLEAMEREPESIKLKVAKPETIKVLDIELKDNGQLTLYFDANYFSLTGVKEILCRAAIIKTLCQIEKVEYVEFYVGGEPLMETHEKPVGFQKADDFVDNTGGETDFYQTVTMTLFFANQKGNALKEIHVKAQFDGTITLEQLILQNLIDGPDEIGGVEEDSIYPTIPSGTSYLKTVIKDGICYVDLNENFLNELPDIDPEVIIYSIVNSLVEMSTVDKVQFTIGGETVKSYKGIGFDAPFERNLDLVKNKS